VELRPVFHALLAILAPSALAAPLELRLVGVDGRGIGGTVVALRSMDASRPLARPIDASIDQVDRQFKPQVLVIPKGTRVSFPNSDSVSHQVYSFSPVKRFQLPLYRGTIHPPVEFERAGTATLGCNIHDHMRAYVFVVEAQHYGRTDPGGIWRVADAEPGEYQVQIWHPLSRDNRPLVDQRITVASTSTTLTLRNPLPLRLRPESQIPPGWDAY
jgi:plastocyanin